MPYKSGCGCRCGRTEAARALYDDLGFTDIGPYYHNPVEGAAYKELVLSAAPEHRPASQNRAEP